jgi:hypothetical protein
MRIIFVVLFVFGNLICVLAEKKCLVDLTDDNYENVASSGSKNKLIYSLFA